MSASLKSPQDRVATIEAIVPRTLFFRVVILNTSFIRNTSFILPILAYTATTTLLPVRRIMASFLPMSSYLSSNYPPASEMEWLMAMEPTKSHSRWDQPSRRALNRACADSSCPSLSRQKQTSRKSAPRGTRTHNPRLKRTLL